jgi:hypothetical protein
VLGVETDRAGVVPAAGRLEPSYPFADAGHASHAVPVATPVVRDPVPVAQQQCSATAIALVDLDRAPVGVFEDHPTSPRHLLMLAQDRGRQLRQGSAGGVERVDEKAGECAAAAASLRCSPGCLGWVDREVNRAELGSRVRGAAVVIFMVERDADGAVEGRCALGVVREQYEGSHLDHEPSMAGMSGIEEAGPTMTGARR